MTPQVQHEVSIVEDIQKIINDEKELIKKQEVVPGTINPQHLQRLSELKVIQHAIDSEKPNFLQLFFKLMEITQNIPSTYSVQLLRRTMEIKYKLDFL